MQYAVYILKCNDGTLYTGYTADLQKRLHEHNRTPYGAKYTKVRRPVSLVYTEKYISKGDAMRREIEIKTYSRTEKLKLVRGARV